MTLHLTLKYRWFEMIESGIKREEYRSIKRFWISRLLSNIEYLTTEQDIQAVSPVFKPFTHVKFTLGYQRNAPTMTFAIEGIDIGPAKPEWSDNWPGNVFRIKIGERIEETTSTPEAGEK